MLLNFTIEEIKTLYEAVLHESDYHYDNYLILEDDVDNISGRNQDWHVEYKKFEKYESLVDRLQTIIEDFSEKKKFILGLCSEGLDQYSNEKEIK